ncbi:MAG: GYF domain-containing protein [Planctomycetales bacterium]|nr:GYF domain-containing protein [Planctomycetales bacterium]
MAAEWYCKTPIDGFGPFTSEELKTFAADGRISPSTIVRKGADGQWIRAFNIKGLFDAPTPQKSPNPTSRIRSVSPPRIRSASFEEQPRVASTPSRVKSGSQNANKSSLSRLWSFLGVFLVACVMFVLWQAYSSNQKRIADANREIARAAQMADEWIGGDSSFPDDDIEQRLTRALANPIATLKQNGNLTLENLRQAGTQKREKKLAAELLQAAKEKLDRKEVKEAMAVLEKYLANDAATEKQYARQLLKEAEVAVSDSLALKSMVAMDAAAFNLVKDGDTTEDGLITYPSLLDVRKQTVARNLHKALQQRASIELEKEKQRIAKAKQREELDAQNKEFAELAKRVPDVRNVCWGDSPRIVKLIEKTVFHEYEDALAGDVLLGQIPTGIVFRFHERQLIGAFYCIDSKKVAYSSLELLKTGLEAKYGNGLSEQDTIATLYSSSTAWETPRSKILYSSISLGSTNVLRLEYTNKNFDWQVYEQLKKREKQDADRRREQDLKDKAQETFKNNL